MMPVKFFAALLGFGFVAMWIAFDFGNAILCLLGALLFYLVAALLRGELDLAEVQSRFTRRA
jgi:glycopeptide antibiotics resistance protein